MPRHASVATVIEKNRIASGMAFVVLMEVQVKGLGGGPSEVVRYARNSENVTFMGETYLASNFDMNMESSTSEYPSVQITVVDPTRDLQSRLEAYDGGIAFEIRLMVVNEGDLNSPADIDETFFVLSTSTKSYIATMTLGARNPLNQRFPRRLQLRDRCSWRYKGAECGYTGAISGCDYSLTGPNGCRAHDNERRFGGFPGLKSRNTG